MHPGGGDRNFCHRRGRQRSQGVRFLRLLRASYLKDEIVLSEWFLKKKVLPLFNKVYGYAPVADDGKTDFRKAFLKVNNETRKENDNRIYEIGRQSGDKMLWKGKFNQLPNSKVGATFADHRKYLMDGEVIDRQYHLGYDLSVTRKHPVPASNSGVVVFAESPGHIRQHGHHRPMEWGLCRFTPI